MKANEAPENVYLALNAFGDMTDNVQKIREMIGKRYEYWKEKEFNSHSIESEIRMSECQHLLLMLDSLQEELVSDDLNKAAIAYNKKVNFVVTGNIPNEHFIAGAKWQKARNQETTETAIHHAYHNGRFNLMLRDICEVINTYLANHHKENEEDFGRNILANMISNAMELKGLGRK